MTTVPNFCVACDHQLSHDEVIGSLGVCPRCGHESDTMTCAITTRAIDLERLTGKHRVDAPWVPCLLAVVRPR